MNFVLHHHLATRDLGSSAAGVGAMLPDLWRMADRRVKPAREQPAAAVTEREGVLGEVLAGIDHHVARDRWFHVDPVFVDGERLAVERLKAASFGATRMGMFAHVLWELCLDGALIARVGLGEVLASLRAGLAAVEGERGPGARAVEIHHFDRIARSTDEREGFDHRMRRLFMEIARGPWIDGYQTGEGVAFRIEGVRSRLGLDPVDAEDHDKLAGVAGSLLEEAPCVVDRILAIDHAHAV